MIITVQAIFAYHLPKTTQVVARLQAARTGDQQILHEALTLGSASLTESQEGGERLLRGVVAPGELRISYSAAVDNGAREPLRASAAQQDWADLPVDVYGYLLPSRFCPTDKFLRFAKRQFGNLGGGAAVIAILDWIYSHVDYVSGASTPSTTAEHTFVDRAGVCRDFAHLAITLIRAAGIPARAVAAYAHRLDPPDFHAVVEVWLDGRWWLADPTRLAPVEGLVRIASGRDAGDIAFLTTSGDIELIELSVNAGLWVPPVTPLPLGSA